MAVVLVTDIYRYQCMSSDVMPTTGVKDGSTCHVIDTGEKYVMHGGLWEQDMRDIYVTQHVQ